MNDQDYIKEAVELADGWGWVIYPNGSLTLLINDGEFIEDDPSISPYDMPKILKAALAEQLTDQVDAIHPEMLTVWSDLTRLRSGTDKFFSDGRGRSMNTIKAIVDSRVLVK